MTCECCRSGGDRLLNSASVMVLVASKCGAARESLLTVGIWTFVWTLARVYPTMAC